ncbi:MAG: MerR family transcriptional regulator [Chloroflexota bacterium]
MQEYSIQDLSQLTNIPRRTIHFYSQQGLLPAPEGGGPGTFYNEIHLLCLKLIPLLKSGGMRLDDIRELFKEKSAEQLQALFEQVNLPREPQPAILPVSQPFAHYQLPAGMMLSVPGTLSTAERKKLSEILNFISRVFSE